MPAISPLLPGSPGCEARGDPQAGHTSLPKLVVPQTEQVMKRERRACQARKPAPAASKGRRISNRVTPPRTSSRRRPAVLGRRSRMAATTTQNQGKEDRCIQRWKRGLRSIHRSHAARASMPAQARRRVETIQRSAPPSKTSRGSTVNAARVARTTKPTAALARSRLVGREGSLRGKIRVGRVTDTPSTSLHLASLAMEFARRGSADGPPRGVPAIVTLKH